MAQPRKQRPGRIGFAIAAALAGLFALAGCAGAAAGVDVVSLAVTQKTVADHLVSFATGEDCSLVGMSSGKPYCVDPNAPPPEEPVYYCYRTLGAVTCYDEPDPYGAGDRRVN